MDIANDLDEAELGKVDYHWAGRLCRGERALLGVRIARPNMSRGNAMAAELMSQSVLSAPQETTVVEAIALMLREGHKRLVVVDEIGRSIGIVDRQTLMAASLGV